MPFLATMPMTMINPMNDERLNVVRVISKARKTPDVDSSADAITAIGAANAAEFEQQDREDQDDGQREHDHQIVKRLLLFGEQAAVLDPDRRRQMQIGDRALHRRDAGAEIDALRAVRVTVTFRCRFSRRTSVWPGISSTVASEPSVPVRPVELTSSVFLIASTEARVDSGNRTRIV